MNIIFLDIDGVLNSEAKLNRLWNEFHDTSLFHPIPFDEIALENLNTLVRETNSKIVVTSTWRLSSHINDLIVALKDYNLDTEIIGYTRFIENATRGTEINDFLSHLGYRPNFIILDDDEDMDDLLPFLIKTNPQLGLTIQNTKDAIARLNSSLIKENTDFER